MGNSELAAAKPAAYKKNKAIAFEHPIVRTHPETGRKTLYLSRSHTVNFKGMTEEESKPLIGYLIEHQVRPEFIFRVRRAPEMLTVWDNRCTQHNAVNDYHGQGRRMRRLTVGAQVPKVGAHIPRARRSSMVRAANYFRHITRTCF